MTSARIPGDARVLVSGAAAGGLAAAAWAALEPRAARALGHEFSDVRLFGRIVGGERAWRPVGTAAHLTNGAAFGAILAATGPLTFGRAITWVAVETVVTWPLIAVADLIHPDRRSGRWPRLVTDRRVMVHEVLMHAVFAVVMGTLFAFARRAGSRR